jgi:hypothetical protein
MIDEKYKILVRKPERKRPVGRPRHIRMDRKQGGKLWSGFVWLGMGTSVGFLWTK